MDRVRSIRQISFYYGPGKLDFQHWVAGVILNHTCICSNLLKQEMRLGPSRLLFNFTHESERP